MNKHPKIVFDHPGEPKKTPLEKPEKSYKGLSRLEREVDGDYQRDVETMQTRETYYCISYLISEMVGQEQYMDELMEVCVSYDYEEPGRYFIYSMSRESCVEYLENLCIQCEDSESVSDLREAVESNASEDWQDFCESENLEEHIIEALEHWLVSDWFADKLESQGEMILRDFQGLTIWGRTTSGQSIHMDSVICNIYNELNAGDI